jgi:hypothetical protein
MNSLAQAIETLTKYGLNPAWTDESLRVATLARLPKSEDRKLFNRYAGGCNTRAELIELIAQTLQAFDKRKTPLRPPPLVQDETPIEELQTPYSVK